MSFTEKSSNSTNHKLTILISYVQDTKKRMSLDDEFNVLLQKICRDNNNLCLTPDSTTQLIDTMVKTIVGDFVFDFVGWYMFDAEFGTRSMTYTLDNHSYDVSEQGLAEFLNNILWFDESNKVL